MRRKHFSFITDKNKLNNGQKISNFESINVRTCLPPFKRLEYIFSRDIVGPTLELYTERTRMVFVRPQTIQFGPRWTSISKKSLSIILNTKLTSLLVTHYLCTCVSTNNVQNENYVLFLKYVKKNNIKQIILVVFIRNISVINSNATSY